MKPYFNKLKLLLLALSLLGVLPMRAQYCSSNATSSADSEIDRVVLVGDVVTINQASVSTCATYTNNTALPAADITIGSSYSVNITLGTCGGNYNKSATVFIDWNQDNDFSDAGENVGSTAFTTATATLSVVFTAGGCAGSGTPGQTRMRVVLAEGGAPGPCGTYSWGETEDYTVLVKAGAPAAGDFVLMDDAVETGAGCVQLTSNATGQQGYAWAQNSVLDFSTNFSYDFTVNLGSNDGGADGIAFIIQNSPAGRCATGNGGWGAGGITNSLILEIDTYLNSEDRDDAMPGVLCSGGTEPDHLDFWLNGNINPAGVCGSSPGARVIPAAIRLMGGGLNYNIENGLNHILRLSWSTGAPGTITASILNMAGTITYGTVSYSFNPMAVFGTNTPFYGFVASTGALSNQHSFCVPSILLGNATDFEVKLLSGAVAINWESKNEDPGDYYIIEKSADGIDFQALSQIEGLGMAHNYKLEDPQPFAGTTYYRLKEMSV